MNNGESKKFGDFSVNKSIDGNFITVSDDSMEWHVQFAEKVTMFHIVESVVDNEEGAEGIIGGLVNFWFVQTTMFFDEEYMNEVYESTKKFRERFEAKVSEVTEEEINAVLNSAHAVQ